MTDDKKDVTGFHFSRATIIGEDKSINVEWDDQVNKPEPKPAPKSGMRRIRFNMLRPSKFSGYDGSWIVASETSRGHFYSLGVNIKTTLTLQTFPKKKSEPRLRPETYGQLIAYQQIGEITIKSSGKKHPLYEHMYVMAKESPGEIQMKMNGNQSNVSIVERFVVTLHPSFEFTSAAIAEMLKNRGFKRITSREIGRILPPLVAKGDLIITSYTPKVYRNKEQVIE